MNLNQPGQSLGTAASMVAGGLASGYMKGEMAAGALSNIPQVKANLPTAQDEATAPFDYKISEAIGSLGGFLLDLSTVGKVVEPALVATGLAAPTSEISGETGPGMLKFLQTGRASAAVDYLTQNFPKISEWVFGAAADETQGAAIRAGLNDMTKLAISFNILDQMKLPLNANIETRLTDLAKSTMSAVLLGRIGLSTDPIVKLGGNFAYGFGSTMLQSGNKEDAFIQGILWSALGEMGGVQITQDQMFNNQYKFSVDNLKQQVPEAAPIIDDIDTAIKAYSNEGPSQTAAEPQASPEDVQKSMAAMLNTPDEAAAAAATPETPAAPKTNVTSQYVPIYGDGIDDFIMGKKKLRIADTGTTTDWKEALGPSRYMRTFRKASNAESTDEYADSMGMSENDFMNEVSKRLAANTNNRDHNLEVYAYLNGKVKDLDEVLSKNKTAVLSSLNVDDVANALRDTHSLNISDAITPDVLARFQAKAESESSRLAVAGDELAEMHDTTTAGTRGSGIKIDPNKPYMSEESGLSSDEIVNRGLRESLEATLAGKLDEPKSQRSAMASIEQKAYLKNLISQLPDITNEQRAALRTAIDRAKNTNSLDAIKERALSSEVSKMKESVDKGSARVYAQRADKEFLGKIVDAYKKTTGTNDDLAKSVVGAAGLDIKNTGKAMQTANALIHEFGVSDIADFHDFLNKVMGGSMDKQTSFEMNRDAIMQKINDTVSYDQEAPEFNDADRKAIDNIGETYTDSEGNKIKFDVVDPKAVEEQAPELSSHMDLDTQLAQLLDVSMRKEPLGPKRRGMAVDDETILAARYRHDTITHEGGHILDARYNITDGLKDATDPVSNLVSKELVNNFADDRKAVYKPAKWLSEGFADYMSKYLGGQDVSKFPLTNKMLDDVMGEKNPEMWTGLQQIRQQAINVENAPALARANAAAQQNDKPLYETIADEAKQKGFVNMMKTGLKDLYRRELNLVGNFSDIDKLVGMDPKDKDSLTTAAILHSGMKNGMVEDIMRNGVYADIRDAFDKSSHDDKRATRGLYQIKDDVPDQYDADFRRYLTALQFEQQNIRADTQGIKLSEPKNYDRASIAQIKASVEAEFPDAPKVAKELADFNKAARRLYQQGGRLTQDEIMQMEQMPRFTTLQRKGGFFDNDFTYNKFISSIGKHFSGSEREDVVDPWQGIADDLHAAVSAAVEGNMDSKLYDIATSRPSDKLRTVVPSRTLVARLSPEEVMSQYEKFNEPLEPEDKDFIMEAMRRNPEMLQKIFRPRTTNDPNIRQLWIDGAAKYVYMDRGMSDWLDAERKRSDAGWAVKLGMMSAKLKRMTATVLSPGFLITHTLREYYTTLENGERVTDNTYGFSMFTHAADVLKGMYQYSKGSKAYGQSEAFDNAVKFGVVQKNRIGEDSQYLDQVVKADRSGFSIVPDMFNKLNNMMRGLVSASDSAGRLAVLSKYDMKNPDDLIAGMKDAKQAGIDWNQRGKSTSELSRLNDVLGFAKAGVLAGEKGIEALGSPTRLIKTFWPLVLTSLAVQYANKDNAQFSNIPMSRRMSSMNFPLPNGKMVTIPIGGNLPLLLLWNMPQIIVQGLQKKDPKLAEDFVSQVLGEVGRTNFSGEGLTAFQAWMPDAIQQFNALTLEPAFNKNLFTGMSIVPTALQKLEPSYQYEGYTSGTAVGISKALSAMTGGKTQVSPMQLDNFLQNSLYGSYTFFTQTLDTALDSLHINPNELQKMPDAGTIPFLNRFVHDAYTPGSQYYVQRTFDLYDQYKVAYDTYLNLEKTNPSAAPAFAKQNGVAINYWPVVDQWFKRYNATATSYRAIEGQKNLDPTTQASSLSNITDGFLKTTQDTLQTLQVFQK
jgi:hypothetical protein